MGGDTGGNEGWKRVEDVVKSRNEESNRYVDSGLVESNNVGKDGMGYPV